MLDDTLFLALETISLNKQALIFASTRSIAEKTAEDISLKTSFFFPELATQVLKGISSPTKQCHRLSSCVKKGIAFHHAGLTSKQKELVEEEFRKGTIKIICCTPTLAMGMSLPAFRVIIKSLKRYSGKWGMDWIPVLEYLQMAGRAGRPEFESYGEAISLAKTELDSLDIYNRYICGQPEDIYSKLAVEPVLRTYLLSLISTEIANSRTDLLNFFSKTFWAHQFKDMEKIGVIIDRMLLLLKDFGFIEFSSNNSADFVAANQLAENYFIRATLIGRRVSELYLDPVTANHLICGLNKSSEINLTPFSFLQLISHTLENYPLLKVKVKEFEEVQEQLLLKKAQFLENEPSVYDLDYDEFISSVKTALFLEYWINESEEDFLLEKFDIRPGEIHVKLEVADWLLYSTAELARLLKLQSILKDLNKLRIRVKKGVKEELLPLLQLKGIGRKRARKLFNRGIRNLGDLNTVDLTTLSQLLGTTLALDLKKQLGAEIKPVPEKQTLGQLSLKKY